MEGDKRKDEICSTRFIYADSPVADSCTKLTFSVQT